MQISEVQRLAESQAENDRYCETYKKQLKVYWNIFRKYFERQGDTEFSSTKAIEYCVNVYGNNKPTPNLPRYKAEGIRAILKLVEIIEKHEFETSERRNKENLLQENLGILNEFRGFLITLNLNEKTVYKRIRTIERFLIYLKTTGQSIKSINFETPKKYCDWDEKASPYKKYESLMSFRRFFHWLFQKKILDKDYSNFTYAIKKPPREREAKVYTPEQVKKILSSIDLSSYTGKRDYLIILMAALYGLRVSELATIKCSDIDWKNNVIHLHQIKTKNNIDLPLLPEVGNAIIDYYKNSRPKTSATNNLFVSYHNPTFGKELSNGSISNIFNNVLKLSGIKNWWLEKHGLHNLRFSLATNLLQANTPSTVIQQILGHQNISTTMEYVKTDLIHLRECCLDMPDCIAVEYQGIERWEV
ncbi:tyrosine-type recombinase/integrase [uncultured Sutterella sp.]|uniref:tyrosine-type recombinase/integrase n=1 Tax=uncultured Sutterella sp. TaxID=286133 RepID=UPI002602D90C|nr:tyrosine-type recombinase/integrase [uncultured Sutterella sp.]